MKKKKSISSSPASSGQTPKKAKRTKKKTPPTAAAAASANAGLPDIDHRVFIERNVHYFSKSDGWIAAATPFNDFKTGKTNQLSFHRDGSLPGEVKTKAFVYATEMESYFWGIDYRATGTTVPEIAALATKPDNDMQALLDVAVKGYQPA
jgi:hypothetical protein